MEYDLMLGEFTEQWLNHDMHECHAGLAGSSNPSLSSHFDRLLREVSPSSLPGRKTAPDEAVKIKRTIAMGKPKDRNVTSKGQDY